MTTFNYEEIGNLIRTTSDETSVYVGSDSQINGSVTDMVTVIIVHFDSKHGSKIFHIWGRENRRLSMRERLWREVYASSQAANGIVDYVGMRHMEVHLDLNPNPRHKSYSIIKEAINYVGGMGFEVRTKPHSAFAATYAADHILKH